MLCYARTGLTEGVVTGPGRQAYLAADPLIIQEGRQVMTQAVTKCQIKVRGQGICVWICQPNNHLDLTIQEALLKRTPLGMQILTVNQCHTGPPRGWDCNRCRRDQRQPLPWLLLPSPDCRFESDRSSLSTALSMSSIPDRSEGSQHSQHGRWCREVGAHVKINLPVFKDEDAKDAITYQSWRWDLTVYWCVGCRDCTLLPYDIWSLQGYPSELVQSSSTDITLDDVLTILDEHYNNVKALDTLNQELFQLWMVDKETVSDWGVCLSRHLQVLAASFPDCFPLNE